MAVSNLSSSLLVRPLSLSAAVARVMSVGAASPAGATDLSEPSARAIAVAAGMLPGLLERACAALPLLGPQAVLDALGTPTTGDGLIPLDDFVEDVLRVVERLAPSPAALTAASLLLGPGASLRDLLAVAGLTPSEALGAVDTWTASGIAAQLEGVVGLIAPVRGVLQDQLELNVPLGGALVQFQQLLALRLELRPGGGVSTATRDYILSAVAVRSLPSAVRWMLIGTLDEAVSASPDRELLLRLERIEQGRPLGHLLAARRLRRQGRAAEAIELLAEPPADADLAPACALERGRGLYALGRFDEATALLASVAAPAPRQWTGEALRIRAAIAHGEDDIPLARELVRGAIEAARLDGDLRAEGRALGLHAVVELADLQVEEALIAAVRAKALAAAEADVTFVAAADITLALIRMTTARYDDAAASIRSAKAALAGTPEVPLHVLVGTTEAMLHLDRGDLATARAALEATLAACDDRQPRMLAWASAHFALLLALEGNQKSAAERLIADSQRFAAMRDTRTAALLDVWRRAALHNAEGPQVTLPSALRSADLVALNELASGRVPATTSSPWIRLALRVRQLHSRPVVASDGSWFRVPGAAPVDLRRRVPARRVLAALVAQVGRGGRRLSVVELVEAAWPGDRSRFEAARSRVYVAVNELRRAGLHDVLASDSTGYALTGVDVAVGEPTDA